MKLSNDFASRVVKAQDSGMTCRVLENGGMFVPYGEFPHPQGMQIFDQLSAMKIKTAFDSLLGKLRRTIAASPVIGDLSAFSLGCPVYDGHPDDPLKKAEYPDKTAYGWITGVRLDDGGCTFLTDWGPDGLDIIRKKAKLFYSPYWSLEPAMDRRGCYRPNALISVGLTNRPNIPVPAMSNSIGQTFEQNLFAAFSNQAPDNSFTERLLEAFSNDFHPDQARGEHGKWVAGGEVAETSKSKNAKLGEHYRDATPEDIKKQGIAPSYKNVKVTDDPKAEKLWTATHTTPAGKQVSKAGYSKAYQEANEGAKWKRIEALHKDFPALDKKIRDDIKAGGKDAEKAMTLHLINKTGFRNGGEDGGGRVKAYGASSLLTNHAKTEGDKTHFDFIGKEGIRQQHSVDDKAIADHVRAKQAAGDEKLFGHNDAGTRDYLSKISGDKYKVHDLRTYHGTALADHEISQRGGLPTDPKAFKAAQKEIATKVSKELGNEPMMALKNYIHPGVWQK